MRGGLVAGLLASSALLAGQTPLEVKPPWPTGTPTFHLFFLGHEIGAEHDQTTASGPLECFFRFVDRGTTIELRAGLERSDDGSVQSLAVKGRNYRLFTSDSEVTVRNGRAHVLDLTAQSDIDLGGRPFFPVDNYAPIGVQDALVKYW